MTDVLMLLRGLSLGSCQGPYVWAYLWYQEQKMLKQSPREASGGNEAGSQEGREEDRMEQGTKGIKGQ